MWGDQVEWVVCRKYWFLDTSTYCLQFLLYLIVFSQTKLFVSLELQVRFWWGFQQNKKLFDCLTKWIKKQKFDSAWHKTHFAHFDGVFSKTKLFDCLTKWFKKQKFDSAWHKTHFAWSHLEIFVLAMWRPYGVVIREKWSCK